MEYKKNPKLELSRYSTLFFSIGLAMANALVLLVFEWETEKISSTVNIENNEALFEEVIDDVPLTKQDQPPPPKIQQPQIIEVPDEEQIKEDIEIDLDIEMTEDAVIEDIVRESAPEEEISDEVFTVVEQMPSFPGGTEEFYEFVSQNIKYPRKALRANVEGKVIVKFIVMEDGDISQVEVIKGIGFDCDEEAVRVLKSSPDWIPGKHQGRNVKVTVMLPFTFNI